MARQFEEALLSGDVENIVYNIANGNYSEKDYNIVIEYLDTEKAKFGKRNFNLIAYIGNRVIEQFFINENEDYLTTAQTLTIYKYLSENGKERFNNIVENILIEFYEDF
jgi:hypothetical protein